MTLATRCTACGTAFRVVQDQLKVSEGWVRCGRCGEVFSALEGLFDLSREEATKPFAQSEAMAAESGDVESPVAKASPESDREHAGDDGQALSPRHLPDRISEDAVGAVFGVDAGDGVAAGRSGESGDAPGFFAAMDSEAAPESGQRDDEQMTSVAIGRSS
ncbi:MAG: zinc-ribbon domain-containing protein, partial [Caldimonas sp.]